MSLSPINVGSLWGLSAQPLDRSCQG